MTVIEPSVLRRRLLLTIGKYLLFPNSAPLVGESVLQNKTRDSSGLGVFLFYRREVEGVAETETDWVWIEKQIKWHKNTEKIAAISHCKTGGF